jgi:uncharacterized cupin superfamily protein
MSSGLTGRRKRMTERTSMATPAKTAVTTDNPSDYEDFPLPDVIDGKPEGKVHWLRTSTEGDGQLLTGMFTAQPSKVNYEFVGDESLHLMEGRVTVEMSDGETVEMKAGDVASFPKGAKSVWTIHEPMKKFFVISG